MVIVLWIVLEKNVKEQLINFIIIMCIMTRLQTLMPFKYKWQHVRNYRPVLFVPSLQ